MGHLKTVIILAGGFVLFNESMPPKKLAGVLCALAGIIWYSWLKMQKKPAAPIPAKSAGQGGESEPLVSRP
jgi:solute carrier family 35 protein E3